MIKLFVFRVLSIPFSSLNDKKGNFIYVNKRWMSDSLHRVVIFCPTKGNSYKFSNVDNLTTNALHMLNINFFQACWYSWFTLVINNCL